MLRDRFITGQYDDTLGRESLEDHLSEPPCQVSAVPRAPGENPVVTGGVSGSQNAQVAQQVANGTSAQRQDGGDSEQGKAMIGWTREGRCKWVEESPRLLGQLLMIPVEIASSLASFLRLLVPEDAVLAPGYALAGPMGYSDHGSLLSEMQVAYTYHLTKEAGLQETSKKAQKSN